MAGLNTFTLSVILGLILFVSASTSQAARKAPTTPISSVAPNEPQAAYTLSPNESPLTKDGEDEEGILEVEGEEEEDDECSGLEIEECLKRRSMAAHTDYIYTQDINNGP